MAWEKGQSGNPKGRPKDNTAIERLNEAIAETEKKKGKKLMVHFVERAFDNDKVLIGLVKKLIPDMTKTEVEGLLENILVIGPKRPEETEEKGEKEDD